MSAGRRDDEDWAALLSGHDPGTADPATRAEATLLRAAWRRWPEADPVDVRTDAEGLDALLAAARAGGVTRRRFGCPGCLARWRGLRRWWAGRGPGTAAWGGLVLAGVLGVALLPALWTAAPDDAPVMRGAEGVQVRTVADVDAACAALADGLAQRGADLQRYTRHGRCGIDAEWPAGGPDEPTRAWLQAQGLAPSADGSLRVEFASRPD